jgi:hypothetical protein
MTLFIYLDDLRDPPNDGNDWKLFREPQSVFSFLIESYYCNGEDIVVSLDHDLGDGVPTGYDLLNQVECAIAISKDFNPNIEFRIHSANTVGCENMKRCIESIKKLLENKNEI